MKHELIEKYETLMYIANQFRNMVYLKTKTHELVHPNYNINKVYGTMYDYKINDLLMFTSASEKTISLKFNHTPLKLSEFSIENQNYIKEIHHPYIAIHQVLNGIRDLIRDDIIGKELVYKDKKHKIVDVYFSTNVDFEIEGKVNKIISHDYFTE